ncbi:MAG: two component transcriptional regulator [Rhizobacter sp.]|nr:two component transcriptional regulator [Rhizobacter sp.]
MSLAPRVFVVDDDASMRGALVNLLRSVSLPVSAFATAAEFFDAPRPEGASCLVLDIRLPGSSGLDVQRDMAAHGLAMPVIFITGYGTIPMTVRALKAGAVEFLTKPFADADLLQAVHAALAQDEVERLVRGEVRMLDARYASLTPREREVMQSVVIGRLNKQVAAELGVSDITVKVHRRHVMEKMQASSLAELVRISQKLSACVAT